MIIRELKALPGTRWYPLRDASGWDAITGALRSETAVIVVADLTEVPKPRLMDVIGDDAGDQGARGLWCAALDRTR